MTSKIVDKKNTALAKIVSDILDTVIMLNDEHPEQLVELLIEEKSLHDKLNKVEWLLFSTRQKRKGV